MGKEYTETLKEIALLVAELQELIAPFDYKYGNTSLRNPIAVALERVQVELGWELTTEGDDDEN
jgi:hypothetical protein